MKTTLKIMAVDAKDNFMKEYGDMFNAKYPNIKIEVINYVEKNLEKVMNEEKPDILLTSLDEYEQLVHENKLYDLDTVMRNDAFNLEGVNSKIVSYLRETGRGKLYGLNPNFLSKAIYYNKDLFDKYSIPYPQDQMTWEETMQLAKRFPTDEGISGLYMRNFYTLTEEMTRSYNLNEVNVKDMKVTINTDSYKKIFEMILDAYGSKAIVLPDWNLIDVYDPFITGTSAMTMDYYYYINNNINWAQAEKGEDFHLNWDVASAPVNESTRDISPYFKIVAIFSVNAESEQKQVAWEFVKFVNSEEFAKAKSRTIGFALPTRTDYIYNPEGKRMEAFYNLKPDVSHTFIDYDLFPKGFFGNLQGIINSEGKAVMVGVKTLDEAMASMEERGQQLLDKK